MLLCCSNQSITYPRLQIRKQDLDMLNKDLKECNRKAIFYQTCSNIKVPVPGMKSTTCHLLEVRKENILVKKQQKIYM